MNYLDLFSGIGGFALGAYWAGWRFDRHYFSEIDPWCCKIYQQRFPDAIALGDIKGIDGRRLVSDADHDDATLQSERWECPNGSGTQRIGGQCKGWIISGGFPCQDISTVGKGTGITGKRSGLWFEYARLIDEIRPRYAIMENVGALTRRGLDRVLGSLAEVGYDAEWSDIRASDVGAPHRRERIWIVAYPHHESESGLSVNAGVAGSIVYSSQQRCGPWRAESAGQSGKSGASDGREDVADADKQRLEGRYERGERTGEFPHWSSGEAYSGDWSFEPGVGRVAHGVPRRVDRLRGLGNSIVPQIAELIFRQIARRS